MAPSPQLPGQSRRSAPRPLPSPLRCRSRGSLTPPQASPGPCPGRQRHLAAGASRAAGPGEPLPHPSGGFSRVWLQLGIQLGLQLGLQLDTGALTALSVPERRRDSHTGLFENGFLNFVSIPWGGAAPGVVLLECLHVSKISDLLFVFICSTCSFQSPKQKPTD